MEILKNKNIRASPGPDPDPDFSWFRGRTIFAVTQIFPDLRHWIADRNPDPDAEKSGIDDFTYQGLKLSMFIDRLICLLIHYFIVDHIALDLNFYNSLICCSFKVF